MFFKHKKIVTVIIVGFLVLMSSSCYASARITNRLTEEYKKWQGLSIEEKNNTIQPSFFNISIDDFIDKSTASSLYTNVGDSLGTSYVLTRDIEFSVRDQGVTDECWAFSTASVLETNYAKTKNRNLIFSPRHMDYATSRTFLDGTNPRGFNREIGMGNYYLSFAYLTNGQGAVLESDMPFENNTNKTYLAKIDKTPAIKADKYVNYPDMTKTYRSNGDAIYSNGAGTTYTDAQVTYYRNLIKQHIKNYGGVTGYTYIGLDLDDMINVYNGIVSYYNNNVNKRYNHGITIVGWNDDYPVEAFRSDKRPTKPGAYLVINSSAGGRDELHVMAVSYEDVWIDTANFGIIESSEINYDKIYQHDEYGYNVPITLINDTTQSPASSGFIANVYDRQDVSNKDEYLNEVSVYLAKDTNVDVYINSSSDDKTKLSKVKSAGTLNAGYHTIKLDNPIKLTGNKFVIALKLQANNIQVALELNPMTNRMTNNSTFWDLVTSKRGESFTSIDGNTWKDLIDDVKDANICLKGFTTYQNKVGGDTLIGDLNEDGVVSLLDLSLMNQIIVGKLQPTTQMRKAADINNDQSVSLIDLSMLNQIIVGKISV